MTKKILWVIFLLTGIGLIKESSFVQAQEINSPQANPSQISTDALGPQDATRLKEGLDRLEVILQQLQTKLNNQDKVVLEKKSVFNNHLEKIETTLVSIDYSLKNLSLSSESQEELAAQAPILPPQELSQELSAVTSATPSSQEENSKTSAFAEKLAALGLIKSFKNNHLTLFISSGIAVLLIAGGIYFFLLRKKRGVSSSPSNS